MTTYTIMTNKNEADQIVCGNKMYVLRTDSVRYSLGNVVSFAVIDNKRRIEHPIAGYKYIVSFVERGDPIRDGVVLLGLKRIA